MAEREAGAGAEVAGFGALLRRHRVAAGLTQEGLAERAGLSRRGVQHLEAGDARPYPATLDVLAAALALGPEDRARLRGAARAAAPPPAHPPDGRRGRRPPPAGPSNLPLQLTSFVGRERELATTRELLAAHRLVTLIGTGGVGKTRLALEAAGALRPAYPDGIWLAELAALADPALVPQAVATATGVRERPGRPLVATLTDALEPKRLLLVLDNCEHLVAACARLADALLRACPHLTVLATSREALGIAGETVWRVPSLSAPEETGAAGREVPAAGAPDVAGDLARYAAVRLFCERAAAVRPGFALTAESAPAVAQVCARLDGIPLALELAAARVRVLPPQQLLARLEDRFRLLTGGSRTALERHQTLRAAVDWSYALLSDPERTLFARLSVFAGGWTLEAAEAVGAGGGIEASGVLELLARLVDKSLVVADEQPGGTARYRLLETLRQYAQERLEASGEAAAVRLRHAACYAGLAAQTPAYLDRPTAEQGAWYDGLEREHANLRAALGWAAAGGARGDAAEAGLRLGLDLFGFWTVRGHRREGLGWLRRLLAVPAGGPPSALRARALGEAGTLAWMLGDYGAARALAEEGLAVGREAGEPAAVAAALNTLGRLVWARGDYGAARRLLEERLRVRREALGGRPDWAMHYALQMVGWVALAQGDTAAARACCREALAFPTDEGVAAAGTLALQGSVAAAEGDHRTARRLHEEGLAIGRAVGDPGSDGHGTRYLGEDALAVGDAGGAAALFAHSAAVMRDLGEPQFVAAALVGLGDARQAAGDGAGAREAYREALALGRRHGLRPALAGALAGLAGLAAGGGRPERALRLAGAAAALRAAMGAALLPPDRARQERRLRPARRALRRAGAARAAWAAGRALPLAQAVADALEDAPDAPT
jgi:non-specific serine/threonine protein kinase